MFVLGVDHGALGPDFPARAEQHLERLAGAGVRLPRSRPTEPPALPTGSLALRGDVLAAPSAAVPTPPPLPAVRRGLRDRAPPPHRL